MAQVEFKGVFNFFRPEFLNSQFSSLWTRRKCSLHPDIWFLKLLCVALFHLLQWIMFYRWKGWILLLTGSLSGFLQWSELICICTGSKFVMNKIVSFRPACLKSLFLPLPLCVCVCSPVEKWYKRHLTYQIVNWPRHLSLGSVRLAVRAAFQLWSNVSGLVFQEAPEGPADIRLAFYEGDHNDGASNAFDGPGEGRMLIKVATDLPIWSHL